MKSRKLWQYQLSAAGFLLVWGWNSAAFGQFPAGRYSTYGGRVQAPVVSHRHGIPPSAPVPRYDAYAPPAYPFNAPYADYGACDPCAGGYDPLLHRCPNGSCRDNRRSWRHCWVKTCYDPKPAYALPNYGYHATSWRKMDDGGGLSPYSNAMPYPAQPMQGPAANVVPAPAPGATDTPESAPNASPTPNNAIPAPNEGTDQPPAIENPQPAPTTQPHTGLRTPQPYPQQQPYTQQNEEELPEVEAGLAPYPDESSPTVEAKEVIPQKTADSPSLPSDSQGFTEPRGDGEEPQVFLPPAPASPEMNREAIDEENHTQPNGEDWETEQGSGAESREKLPAPNSTDEKSEESPSDFNLPPRSQRPDAEQQPKAAPTLDELETLRGGRDLGEEHWEMPVPYSGPQPSVIRTANAPARTTRRSQADNRSGVTEKNILPTANWGARPKTTSRSAAGTPSSSTRGGEAAATHSRGGAAGYPVIIPIESK